MVKKSGNPVIAEGAYPTLIGAGRRETMNEVKLITSNVAKAFRDLILKTKPQDRIYSCPELPIEIPGITPGDALDANDCMGVQFPLSPCFFVVTLKI